MSDDDCYCPCHFLADFSHDDPCCRECLACQHDIRLDRYDAHLASCAAERRTIIEEIVTAAGCQDELLREFAINGLARAMVAASLGGVEGEIEKFLVFLGADEEQRTALMTAIREAMKDDVLMTEAQRALHRS